MVWSSSSFSDFTPFTIWKETVFLLADSRHSLTWLSSFVLVCLCFGVRMVTLKHEIVSLSSSQHFVSIGYMASVMARACTQFISNESKATDVSSLTFFALGVVGLWDSGWPLAKI